jgi:hypothetical protein
VHYKRIGKLTRKEDALRSRTLRKIATATNNGTNSRKMHGNFKHKEQIRPIVQIEKAVRTQSLLPAGKKRGAENGGGRGARGRWRRRRGEREVAAGGLPIRARRSEDGWEETLECKPARPFIVSRAVP